MAQRKATGTRRVWLPAAVFSLLAAGICTRLLYLQVVQHDHYAALAHEEQAASTTTFARRGSILDRNGNVLATSVDTWDLSVSSRAWSDPIEAQEAAERLSLILSTGTMKTSAAQLLEIVTNGETLDVPVAKDIPYDIGTQILDEHITGTVLHPNTERQNPDTNLGYPILGFLGTDNNGLAGIELEFDDLLQGKPGRVLFERDTTGDPIPYGHYIASDPVPGSDIVLTIDRQLQEIAERTLKAGVEKHQAKSGSIVIADPETMEILALAQYPALTPDVEITGANLDLLRNRAVTDLYEPGSVMKVVTAAAAIDAGVVTPNTYYYDSGKVTIGDTDLRNFDGGVYRDASMTDVLVNSINTGAVFMAQKLGEDRFLQYIDSFGFGQASGIELSGEARGIMRRPDDPAWTEVDLATQSFGQAISVTPIQMVAAFAATINGGELLTPHLAKAYIDAEGNRREVAPQIRSHPISEATSATIRDMLGQVIYNVPGHPATPKLYTAGGKSGTANVAVTNGYDDTQIASFMGFAPLDDPKILILVKLDENADLKTGAAAAGPIFASLVDEVLTYMNVEPNVPYVGRR